MCQPRGGKLVAHEPAWREGASVELRQGEVLDHPSLRVDVDRQRALQLGLHEQDVASSLLTTLSSSTLFAPNFWVNPQNAVNYNVIVEAPYFHVTDVPTLMAVPISPAAISSSLLLSEGPAPLYAPTPTFSNV